MAIYIETKIALILSLWILFFIGVQEIEPRGEMY